MDAVRFLFLCLTFVTGTLAETCLSKEGPFTCIFGCCSDDLFIYCCVSNGGAIGIIVAIIAVILGCISACIRQTRHHRAAHSVPARSTVKAPARSVVSVTRTSGVVNPNFA